MNELYYGDNLDVLRDFESECVDLVYLDPPFNSNANYNVLFKSPQGQESQAQIEAFEDTWHWGEQAEREFGELLRQENTDVAAMMTALRGFLGENDMLAYLTMMANRLLQLHRVLKPTGSLYLHCDPTASHYLKIVLDGVFGGDKYKNEITWKRTTTHSDSKTWSRVSDIILFYTKSDSFTWNTPRESHSDSYLAVKYRFDDGDGKIYRLDNMTSPNPRPNMMYEWKGFPYPDKGWRYSKETMARLDAEGRIWYPTNSDGTMATDRRPQLKRYLEEMEGGVMGCIWTDIPPINSQAQERLGYPTQKPLALLERILNASSNPGDVVLDPFCGCGTALHAAQKLGRRWIGIDITHLAISLIEKRLKAAFKGDVHYETHGTPKDLPGAQDLFQRDPYQFQWWACSLVDAHPYKGKRKGADGGIDGVIYTRDELSGDPKRLLVSVKGGANVDVKMIREFAHVVDSNKAIIGLFVTLAPPKSTMLKEAASAGFYHCPHNGKDYPKIQILTIEGLLLDHERPQYLDLSQGTTTFKQAPREKGPKQKQAKLA